MLYAGPTRHTFPPDLCFAKATLDLHHRRPHTSRSIEISAGGRFVRETRASRPTPSAPEQEKRQTKIKAAHRCTAFQGMGRTKEISQQREACPAQRTTRPRAGRQ